ncbi:hypothetical protein [Lentzea cavernae]|nr:hypothetical protein [Lentzea cavernae]
MRDAVAAEAVIEALHDDLSGLPAGARLDAVLCLLEAARLMVRGLDRPSGELGADDLDRLRATMRAASLSVRSYLWQAGDRDPAARR